MDSYVHFVHTLPIADRRYPGGARNEEGELAKSKEVPVLVTTAHRGVFFGYAEKTDGDAIKLRAMRNCIQWRGLKGFLELASDGPNNQCRIGPRADGEIRNITGVWQCSPEAVKAWEIAPWSK